MGPYPGVSGNMDVAVFSVSLFQQWTVIWSQAVKHLVHS